MIYVHNVGSVHREEGEELDVKAAWKMVSPAMIRRTDRFIQLSLLGAYAAIGEKELERETALYMASGQGNLAVFKRLRDQRYIKKQPPKPVDYINSLSNTSGFYVAQFFKIEGKNLNVSRLGFVAETTLLLAQNDLVLNKVEQVLVGGVDELQEPFSFTRKTLGISDERPLGEGSNWMLLSRKKEGSLASLEVLKQAMGLDELKVYLQQIDVTSQLAFGQRCSKEVIEMLLGDKKHFEVSCGFYETASLYLLNTFIESGKGELIFVDNYEDRYRVVKLNC